MAALCRCNAMLSASALTLLVAVGSSAFSFAPPVDDLATAQGAHQAAIRQWDSVLSKDAYYDAHDEPEGTEEPLPVRCTLPSCIEI